MDLNFSSINWIAVVVCLVIAQGFLSLWFIVLFGNPWAKEYGATDQKAHTKEIPGYTYAIQALCALLMIIGTALIQDAMGIDTLAEGLLFGIFVSVVFSLGTAIPGYVFLKRWKALYMAMGSQTILVIVVSTILAVWK